MFGMLAGIQANHYTSAAAMTIWVYDIILTLDLEVSSYSDVDGVHVA